MWAKQIARVFFLVYSCLIISSCAVSKEEYLFKYERFINDVQAKAADYQSKDWLKADRRFNHFNETLTKRFGNRLTLEDKIRIAKARVIYDSYRYGFELLDDINVISNSIKDGLEYYIDNHLSNDIDFLLEQGVKIGDILTESMNKLDQGNR